MPSLTAAERKAFEDWYDRHALRLDALREEGRTYTIAEETYAHAIAHERQRAAQVCRALANHRHIPTDAATAELCAETIEQGEPL